MNAVDRYDQRRSTNMTRRREKKVSNTMYAFILDCSLNNAYTLYEAALDEGLISLPPNTKRLEMREFKRQCAMAMVASQLKSRNSDIDNVLRRSTDPFLKGLQNGHYLVETGDSNFCFLCKFRSRQEQSAGKVAGRSYLLCPPCGKYYHPNYG